MLRGVVWQNRKTSHHEVGLLLPFAVRLRRPGLTVNTLIALCLYYFRQVSVVGVREAKDCDAIIPMGMGALDGRAGLDCKEV